MGTRWTQREDPSAPGGSASFKGDHGHQASSSLPGTTIQPKKMPRPQTSGECNFILHIAAFRTGRTWTNTVMHTEAEKGDDWTPSEEWVKRKKPSKCGSEAHLRRRRLYQSGAANCIAEIW